MPADTPLSLAELAAAIGRGKLSSEEAVRDCLARIERVNPELNAVVQLRGEAALAEARAADRARRTRRGPLHGVPITIKDSLDTAGIVTTGGTKGRAGHVPKHDATVVARLRAAGAIIVGKTNTPDITLAGETDNLIYGRTNNPYDLARTPGGSSGGAAAIIAAGAVPLDVGSDTGGSIRMPAHFCGIAGLKPTAGRVSRAGHIIDYRGVTQSLTQLGPLARRVDDLALALGIIAGPDGVDPHVPDVPLRDHRRVRVRGLRVAHFTALGALEPTAETAAAVARATRVLKQAGCRTSAVTVPGAADVYVIYMGLIWGDGGAAVARILERWRTAESPLFDRIRGAPRETAGQYSARVERWDQWKCEMLRFVADYDAIVCPIYPEAAPRHGGWDRAKAAFSQLFNLLGWPATAVRAGTSPEGLPIGVQCVAKPWREDVSLAVARRLERELGPWEAPRVT